MKDSGAWDAMGRWFVADPDMLDFYAADVGDGFRVVAVEVDAEAAEGWRVDKNPAAAAFSRDPENEYSSRARSPTPPSRTRLSGALSRSGFLRRPLGCDGRRRGERHQPGLGDAL